MPGSSNDDEEDQDQTVENSIAVLPRSASTGVAVARLSATPAPGIALSASRSVEIRTLGAEEDDENLDETKVRDPSKRGDEEEPVTALDVDLTGGREDDGDEALTLMNQRVVDSSTGSAKRKAEPPIDPADDSITTQAPAAIAELRAVAAAKREEDEQERKESQTAVMIGAPVAPLSDSALSMVKPRSTGERVELDLLGMSAPFPAPQISVVAPSELAPMLEPPRTTAPSLHDVNFDRRPRYGILVGAVAAVSVFVPIVLFFFLSRLPNDDVAPPPSHEPSAEAVPRGDSLRGKATKGAPSASASVSASASSSAKSPPPRAPHR